MSTETQIAKSRIVAAGLAGTDSETLQGTVTIVETGKVTIDLKDGLFEKLIVPETGSNLDGVRIGATVEFNRETGEVISFTNPVEKNTSSPRRSSSTKIASQPLI